MKRTIKSDFYFTDSAVLSYSVVNLDMQSLTVVQPLSRSPVANWQLLSAA